MRLSEILVQYRKANDLSQRELSRRCDLSNSYISFLENEVNPKTGKPIIPTIEQYKKLACGMNISIHHLFELLDEDSPVDLQQPYLDLSPDEQTLLSGYRSLSNDGKEYVLQQVTIAKLAYGEKDNDIPDENQSVGGSE